MEACSSHSHSKTRLTAIKTSWADLSCDGISQMGNTPRLTKASEISITNYDSCVASAVHLSSTPATR
jgi:hypothetical protein